MNANDDWTTVRDPHREANHAIHWRLSHPRLRVRECGHRVTVEMRIGHTRPEWYVVRKHRNLAGAVFWVERQIARASGFYAHVKNPRGSGPICDPGSTNQV